MFGLGKSFFNGCVDGFHSGFVVVLMMFVHFLMFLYLWFY